MIWILGLGVFGAVVSNFQPKPSTVPTDEVQLAKEAADKRDNATLYAAKAAVARSMKDPRSAEFSNSFGWLKHGERVACGYINAKNSFGAMAGSTRWLVRADRGVVLIRDMLNAEKFAPEWNRFCVGNPDDLKDEPTEFLGVSLRKTVPVSLKPYDTAGNVWVPKSAPAQDFLGVSMEPSYMAERDIVKGVQATAKGQQAFGTLRTNLFRTFGVPVSDNGPQGQRTIWNWGPDRTVMQLTYARQQGQTTLSITTR